MSFQFGIEQGQIFFEVIGKPNYSIKEYAALLYMLNHGMFGRQFYQVMAEKLPRETIESILLELGQLEQIDDIPVIPVLEMPEQGKE